MLDDSTPGTSMACDEAICNSNVSDLGLSRGNDGGGGLVFISRIRDISGTVVTNATCGFISTNSLSPIFWHSNSRVMGPLPFGVQGHR
ncbi:hypothetical protein CGCF415_v006882 [Colletotrichum fructicola]|nr:hypothetical protein CFRS1_v008902 [Colletotrichum fructicola]KAF4895957.1 hypothetical protein CGCFRS4_v005810 [Colletotrichum fructicola]KAF4908061.1 hypothetical protein CGCF415_v006882 [Colletotrichum fructicola]KAF4939699.1 hypothetical protein CGCF245_v003473 [Colletotrichum fructicola]